MHTTSESLMQPSNQLSTYEYLDLLTDVDRRKLISHLVDDIHPSFFFERKPLSGVKIVVFNF